MDIAIIVLIIIIILLLLCLLGISYFYYRKIKNRRKSNTKNKKKDEIEDDEIIYDKKNKKKKRRSTMKKRKSKINKTKKRKSKLKQKNDSEKNELLNDDNTLNIIEEESLNSSFFKVLEQGFLIKLHSLGKNNKNISKQIILMKEDNCLKWKYPSAIIKKKYEVLFADIERVELGKVTPIFQDVKNEKLPEDCCFSLILRSGESIDLEASSFMEREALTHGFQTLIESGEFSLV